MLRTAGAVILGYLAMFAIVFVGLTGAYLALGADRAFLPGSYQTSMLWAVTSIIVGLVAAFVGGRVARPVGRTPTAVWVLAALVIVLGIVFALPALTGGPVTVPRTTALGPMEAMQQARTPAWLALLNPVIGAIGVLVGGAAIGRSAPSGAAPTATATA